MSAQYLRDLESSRRHATRVAVVLVVQSTIIERSLTCMTASWAVFSIGLNTVTRSSSRNPDRKSTRLNSSHQIISYAVFSLKKKKKKQITHTQKQKKSKMKKSAHKENCA